MDMKWLDAPVLEKLLQLNGRAWLHMPGHGGYLPWLDAALDTTELPVSDDLYRPYEDGFFRDAQRLYAEAAGAGRSIFLAGGSTLGVQAMLLAFVPPGGRVILPRDAHMAALAACAIGDLEPIYVFPRWEEGAGRAFLNPEDVVSVIKSNPEAAAVLLTYPDYYGVCMDLQPVAKAAKEMGIALLVDEAHGAHFPWGEAGLSSGRQGADAWTHSAHKTLPALTQSAVVHLKEKRNEAAVRRVVHMLGSSSPSFLLAGSVDYARAVMERYGKEWISSTERANSALLKELTDAGYSDSHGVWRGSNRRFDAARLVVEVCPHGLSGYCVMSRLTGSGIDIEMADERRIVCIPPLPGSADALARLKDVLLALDSDGYRPIPRPVLPGPNVRQAISVRKAAFSPAERVSFREAIGRIAAEPVGAYPPGIPLFAPGEQIEEGPIMALMDAHSGGARLFGVTEEGVPVVKE